MEESELMEVRVMNDKKLKTKFEIMGRIGEGCFGKVYKAVNRNTKRYVALKVEMLDETYNNKSNLAIEISILDRLSGVEGVPIMYSAGKWQFGYFMEMELLVSSLQD